MLTRRDVAYGLQLRWCAAPSWVAGHVPRAPDVLPEVVQPGASP